MILKLTLVLTSLLCVAACSPFGDLQSAESQAAAEGLWCFGWCYQIEVGAAAEVLGEEDEIQDVLDSLEDIEEIEKATRDEIQDNINIAEQVAAEVEKIRQLDKAKYKGTELEEVVE